MIFGKDKRMQGQEAYLHGVELVRRPYPHQPGNVFFAPDRCEFRQGGFMVSDDAEYFRQGYCTEDQSHWVCEKCFDDFRALFHWSVRDDQMDR